MRALVTGSTGFIGSHLVESLLDKGYTVSVLLREHSDLKWIRHLPVQEIFGDYADLRSLQKCVCGMDVLFHLAAVLNAPDWETYYRANTLAVKNLIQACEDANPELKRFVFVSSIAAAGPSKHKVFRDEDSPSRPESYYGKSKLQAERIVMSFKDRIPVTIARPPNVIGIRQRELLILLKLLKKRIYPLIGNGDLQTSLCFVQDLSKALILMAEKEEARSQTYYITDNKGHSWRRMLEIIARIMGVYPRVVKVPHPLLLSAARISEIIAGISRQEPLISSRYILSTRTNYHLFLSDRIRRDLGFETEIPFRRGMENIVREYQERGIL